MTSANPTPREFLTGSLLAMVTMTIWAGWNVVSRMGADNGAESLAPADIVFLRFAVAGIGCLPFFFRYIPVYKNIPWYFLLLMICGAGAPYVMLASAGFVYAPASHGVLIPGAMLVWVAIMSRVFLSEEINRLRMIGYALIALVVLWRLFVSGNGEYLYADGMFLSASVLWAIYTVVNKKTVISPFAALMLISAGSLVGFCLPYLLMYGDVIFNLPMKPAITQMLYQGIMVSFVALICYNKAITLIGPSRASAFAAAIPILTVLAAMPILGEMPTTDDWWFVGLLTLGVLFATGVMRRIGEMVKRLSG